MTETNKRIIESTEKGEFCWETINDIAVPFITRPSGEMFVELNMLKKTLLNKERHLLNDEIFNIACPTVDVNLLFKMTDTEKELLDEINSQYCVYYFTNKPYSKDSNFLIKKSDAIELYRILRVFTNIVLSNKLETSKCGFLNIDNSETPIPFVDVENVGMLVPACFFDSPSVREISFCLDDFWPLTYLKLFCKLLSILPRFYDYSTLLVVNVDSLKSIISINQLNVLRSLPLHVQIAGFLRPDSSPITYHAYERAKHVTAPNLQTINKIHFEQTETDDHHVSMAKKPKLRREHSSNTDHTININDSSEDDKFVEKKIKIKIEVNELNTPRKETHAINNFKELENPHKHVAKILSINKGQSTKGITQPKRQRTKAITQSKRQSTKGIKQPKGKGTKGITQPKGQSTKGIKQPKRQSTKCITQPQGQSTKGITHPSKSLEGRSLNMQVFHQTGTLVQQPGTILVSPNHLLPGIHTMMHQPNIMTIPTENQQGNVMYSYLNLPQGSHTNFSASNNWIPAVLNVTNGSQQSEVISKNLLDMDTKAGLISSQTQLITSKPQHITGEDFGDLNIKMCNRKFVKIAPLGRKKLKKMSRLAVDSVADNSFADSNVGNSETISQLSNNSPGLVTSASDSNNILILQPNNVAHNAIMTQAIGGFSQSTPFMDRPFPNRVITSVMSPSGVLTYHSGGSMGNAAPLSLPQNSGQLLTNQSGFVINCNPMLSTSGGIVTLAQNISSSQGVATLSNGVCPIINPNSLNSLENVNTLMVETGQKVFLQGNEEILYKVNEIPKFKGAFHRDSAYYTVVRMKIDKRHTFVCISMDPINHRNLLISVLEIMDKLFPEISRKTFMAIASEMKLQIYALNVQQKTVLKRLYAVDGVTDVSLHLFFHYNEFITCYKLIKQKVSQRYIALSLK